MDGNYWRKDLTARLKVFATNAACILIDSTFLGLWVIVHWALNNCVIEKLELSGIHNWVLSTFQGIFAISTLAPVVVYIYVDIRVIVLRARRRIGREMELGRANDSRNE